MSRKPLQRAAWTPTIAASALFAAGCASTPETRIARHAALFARFPPDIQQKIRAGQVEPGYTEDMVRLALGRPDRVITRLTTEGESTLWVYKRYEPEVWSEPVPVWWPSRSTHRGVRWHPDIWWTHQTWWREEAAARVEFREGRVIAVELSRR